MISAATLRVFLALHVAANSLSKKNVKVDFLLIRKI